MKLEMIISSKGLRLVEGKVMACGTCLRTRNADITDISPISAVKDMHATAKRATEF